jgi:hypothetical protein
MGRPIPERFFNGTGGAGSPGDSARTRRHRDPMPYRWPGAGRDVRVDGAGPLSG